MKTDNPTALCIAFDVDHMALISQQARAHGMSAEDWVRETVKRALDTERVERSDDDDTALIPARETFRATMTVRDVREGAILPDPDDEERERSDGAELAASVAESAVAQRRESQ